MKGALCPVSTPASAWVPHGILVATGPQCSGRSGHDARAVLSQDGCGDGVLCSSIQPVGCLVLCDVWWNFGGGSHRVCRFLLVDGTCNDLTPPVLVCSVHSVQAPSFKPPASLVRLVVRYFILYDAVVKGIVFLISF